MALDKEVKEDEAQRIALSELSSRLLELLPTIVETAFIQVNFNCPKLIM